MTTQYRYVNRPSIRRQWALRTALALSLLMGLALTDAVSALQTCVEFLDNFASASFSNNNGTANFTGAWTEIGESSSSATAGDVDVIASGTSQGLHIQSSSNGAQRTLNLSAYDTASLNFIYRRESFDDSADNVLVQISSNGGTSFTTIGTLAGPATDASYQVFSANITAYIASNTVIRFLSSATMAADDDVYIDSFSIAACDRQLTSCGASFPDAASSHSATGSVSFASSGQLLNSPDRILEAPSVTIGVPNTSTCGTNIQCVASASTVATINPGTFRTTAATVDQTVASGATATLGPATTQWDQVILNSNSTLNVSTSTSTVFLIDELVLNSPSTLNLPAGDYWIRNLTIQNGAHINVSGSGTVRIFVNDAASINSSSYVNSPSTNSSGTVSQLVWYSYSDLTLSNGSTMSGLIYSQGNISLGSASYIFGAATAANVALQVNSVISYNATAIDAVNFGGMCSNLYPVASWYAFDEASWTGAAGQVADSGSNNLDGRAIAGSGSPPTTAVSGGTACRYGVFNNPRNGSGDSTTQQYVEVADNNLHDFSTELTVGVWVYVRSWPTSGGLMSVVSKDVNFEFHLRPTGILNWWWNDSSNNTRQFDSTTAVDLNNWHHIAITYKSGAQTIYIDGVAAGSATNTGTLRASGTPLQFGQDQGVTNRFFDGYLDEVRIYNTALSQAQVQEMMGLNHSCSTAIPINHFSIVPSTTQAVTCDSITVTVAPHTSTDGTPTSYTGTVTLTATLTPTSGSPAAAGTWGLVTGTGTLTNTSTGVATYNYSSGESSAVFRYKVTSAGTVNFTAVDGAISASENSAVSFSTAGFIFLVNGVSGSIPTQISAKDSNTGWNSRTLSIRAVTTDPTTGVCTARLPAGAQSIDFGYDCTNPAACNAGAVFNVTGAGAATPITASASAPTSWSSSVTLTFDATATAPFVMNYNDAGQVQLYARKQLTDSTAGPGVELLGNTSVAVRPFGLGFTNILSGTTSNPAGTASTGGGFVAAGSAFSATVAGYRFATGEDSDSDGVPDSGVDVTNNGTTPNFAFTGATVSMPTTLLTPLLTSGGIAGTLTGTPATFNFVSNSASLSNLSYSEVGSLRLRAAATDYLSVADADIQGDSPNIGRFYPQNFLLVSSTTTPACNTPTTAVPFTYMGQPFAVSYQLEARNTANIKTRNYDTSAGYTAGSTAASIAYVAENANAGSSLASRVTVAAGRWDNGVYVLADGASNFTVNNAVFVRNTTPTPVTDGPFGSLQLGIVLTDADSRALSSLDMSATTTGNCSTSSSCTAKAIGAVTEMRYGRLALRDATGSDRAVSIVMPALVEYYNGSQFTRNEADSCTVYGTSQINDVNFSGALAGSYTDARSTAAGRWWLPTDTALSAGLFRNYPSALAVAPVPGVTGTLGVTLNATAPGSIPAWLLYNWSGTGDIGPSATLTLGQARGHDRIILWRERRQ